MELYKDQIMTSQGKLPFLYNDLGLVYVGGFNQPIEEDMISNFSQDGIIYQKNHQGEIYRKMFLEYFEGRRKVFDCPIIFLSGTTFQKKVWEALRNIAFAETLTYSQVAQAIGQPNAVRAVASAIGKNPIAIVVPCHRVLGKDGQLRGFRGGLPMKSWLLNHEAKHRGEDEVVND